MESSASWSRRSRHILGAVNNSQQKSQSMDFKVNWIKVLRFVLDRSEKTFNLDLSDLYPPWSLCDLVVTEFKLENIASEVDFHSPNNAGQH